MANRKLGGEYNEYLKWRQVDERTAEKRQGNGI
jgi:hypothetical protein